MGLTRPGLARGLTIIPLVVNPATELERGRQSYVSQAWLDAYESLSAAAQAGTLDVEDLERLATSAYMLGREDEYLALLERAHGAHRATWGVRLAQRDWQVTGVDIVDKALCRARERVAETGVEMRLVHGDVTALRKASVGLRLPARGGYRDVPRPERRPA